jgi:beta-glucosidase/6-phospho-beta-glucosidase/beta-galactosidase
VSGSLQFPFLFATGIENSAPTLRSGVRIDEMEKCGHYTHWEEDFALVRASGLDALRYGPAYYRTHVSPTHYDWDVADAPMRRLRDLGIHVIADLCHFSVPSWLGGFQDAAFPVLFGEYAGAFARRYPWVRYFTPVNEIFVAASFSALYGWWNECEASDATFVRAMRNLCMAHELAVGAILQERPDAIIVQRESIEYFHAPPEAAVEADRLNRMKYLSLDLTLGHELEPGMARHLHDNGVTSNDLSFFRERRAEGQRWLGVDYYRTCEHRMSPSGAWVTEPESLGLSSVASRYYHRYRLPLFHCETNRASPYAVSWLDRQWREAMRLRTLGVPLRGFTWYSLTDQIDWQHGLRVERNDVHPVGLFDLDRRIRPVGTAYREIVRRWRPLLVAGPVLADDGVRQRIAGAEAT